MKSWCKQKSPVYLIQRLMFRNLAKLPGDALLFCLLLLSRDKDRESHSPRNLETCTMTWPRPGALPSPKESTMTWWICQKSQKIGHSHLSPSPRTLHCHFSLVQFNPAIIFDQYHPTLLLQVTREKIAGNLATPGHHLPRSLFALLRGKLLEEALSRCRAAYRTWHH